MSPSLHNAADMFKKTFALHKTAGAYGQTTLTTLSVIHQAVMSWRLHWQPSNGRKSYNRWRVRQLPFRKRGAPVSLSQVD